MEVFGYFRTGPDSSVGRVSAPGNGRLLIVWAKQFIWTLVICGCSATVLLSPAILEKIIDILFCCLSPKNTHIPPAPVAQSVECLLYGTGDRRFAPGL